MEKLELLSKKQIIGVLGWFNNQGKNFFGSFTECINAINIDSVKNENSSIAIELGNKTYCIEHGFFDLYEYEEDFLLKHL